MSEKRNLVHWSILALRDCKLPLTSIRHFFPVCINAFCKFSFAYYSFIGSRFWQSVCLFLLLIIQDTGLLPADWNLFTSVIQKTRKWQPGRQKIFLFTLNTPALPVLPKIDTKKAANLFQDLLLYMPLVGGALFSFRFIRQFQPEFEQASDERLYHKIMPVSYGIVLFTHQIFKGDFQPPLPLQSSDGTDSSMAYDNLAIGIHRYTE